MTTMCMEEMERDRQVEMEHWLQARAEMNRLLAERDSRDDWEQWAEQQITAFKRPEILRQMLAMNNPQTV